MSRSDLGSIGQGVGPNQLPIQAQAYPTTRQPMEQITIKIPNPKCRLYRCNRVYRLEIQAVMLVFSPPLVS